MTFAMLLTTVTVAISVATVVIIGGKHTFYITSMPALMLFGKLATVETCLTVWCVTVTKISILVMLRRVLQASHRWRVTIAVIIVLAFVGSVVTTTLAMLLCRPTAALWDKTIVGAKCFSLNAQSNIAIGMSGKWTSRGDGMGRADGVQFSMR